MRQYIRQSAAADVLVSLPTDQPVSAVEAQLYGPDGVADWAPAHTVTHPSWTLGSASAAKTSSLSVTWGSLRPVQAGEEITLSTASTPYKGATESVICAYPGANGKITLTSPLRLSWDTGAVVQPRVIRVPLTASDTASTGRNFRVEVKVTLHSTVPEAERTIYCTEILDVVKHVPRCTLTLAGLRGLYPNLFGRLSGDMSRESSEVEDLLQRCFALVVSDVSRKVSPDHIYSDSDLEAPTVARMLLELARDGRLYPEEVDRQGVIEGAYGHYKRSLEESLSSMGWVDKNEDGVPGTGETQRSVLPRITRTL